MLKARLHPFEEPYATIDSERTARRQPLEKQIAEVESQKRDCEEQLERVLKGRSVTQDCAVALREGRAGEGTALYVSLRDLLAKGEKFAAHVAGVEKILAEDARMSAIAKRHAHFVEQARLELEAPINATGALARAQEGQIEHAKRMLELALRRGLDENKANEIRKAITQAEYHALIKEWEQEIVRCAPQLNGMNTVNRYKEHIADKSREAGYERLSRDLARAISHAEKLAGQGAAARRRMLEAHAAQYINSQNKFFSAQFMPDSGRVMIAVKKNGVWLRHALCHLVKGESGYEIKTNYYERKTALDDQGEWDTRRVRLEKKLPAPSDEGVETIAM